MDHTGKEAEAVGVLVSCPRGPCRTGCPADTRGHGRPTAPGRGGEEASSDPVPDWACCLPAYPSERCLHPRDRQHRFFGAAELVLGPSAAQACWKGGSQFWFVFVLVFLIPVAFSLCAGEIGGCFPLSELEKRPDYGQEWVGDFLLPLSFGRLLQLSPPVVIVLLAFCRRVVREESRI